MIKYKVENSKLKFILSVELVIKCNIELEFSKAAKETAVLEKVGD